VASGDLGVVVPVVPVVPVVALVFGLFEAPGDAASCEPPISLHAPSAAAAASAIVAIAIF
jgi:hypothetical protein